MTKQDILKELFSLSQPQRVQGMLRFGIRGKVIGVSVVELRAMAKHIDKNTPLAMGIWNEQYREARILATMIADKNDFSAEQMDFMTKDFDSWDITDQACFNLFRHLPFYNEKIFEYVKSDEEFVRRTAFSLIAGLAVGNKKMADTELLNYLPLIKEYSFDERNFVWKAVNWALRQIGKRNKNLYPYSVRVAKELSLSQDKTAIKIGKDALRELSDEKVIARIK
jgi:Predicted DNA alkylation repair enzyme